MYDLLLEFIYVIYKCKVIIILYVMTWESIVTNYYNKYFKSIKFLTKLNHISNPQY